jgi:hypothetical protein
MKTKTTEEKIVSGGKAIATVVKVVITIGVGLAAPTVLGTCLGAGAGLEQWCILWLGLLGAVV